MKPEKKFAHHVTRNEIIDDFQKSCFCRVSMDGIHECGHNL